MCAEGANPSADLEHPGPPPPSVGQGTGGGPTKKGAEGHNTPQNGSSSGQGASGGKDGPQPKIHKHDAPEEHTHSDDVKAHNEDMAKRHDRANEKSPDKEENDKVGNGFWSGGCVWSSASSVLIPHHRPAALIGIHELFSIPWTLDNEDAIY